MYFRQAITRSIFFLLAIFIFIANDLQAHVDHGNMPDDIAEVEYRILLDMQPENIEARNRLAMILYRLDRLDEAHAELQRVLESDPGNFDALDALGLVEFKQGKAEQALVYLETAARMNSEDLLVHYHLGLVQGYLGLLDAAETSLMKALMMNIEQKGGAGDANENIELIESALAEIRARKKEKI